VKCCQHFRALENFQAILFLCPLPFLSLSLPLPSRPLHFFYCNLGILLIFYMYIFRILLIQLLGCHIEINACLVFTSLSFYPSLSFPPSPLFFSLPFLFPFLGGPHPSTKTATESRGTVNFAWGLGQSPSQKTIWCVFEPRRTALVATVLWIFVRIKWVKKLLAVQLRRGTHLFSISTRGWSMQVCAYVGHVSIIRFLIVDRWISGLSSLTLFL